MLAFKFWPLDQLMNLMIVSGEGAVVGQVGSRLLLLENLIQHLVAASILPHEEEDKEAEIKPWQLEKWLGKKVERKTEALFSEYFLFTTGCFPLKMLPERECIE